MRHSFPLFDFYGLWILPFVEEFPVLNLGFGISVISFFTGSGMNKCIKDEMKKYHSSLGFFVAFVLLNLVLIIVFCEFVCLFVSLMTLLVFLLLMSFECPLVTHLFNLKCYQ